MDRGSEFILLFPCEHNGLFVLEDFLPCTVCIQDCRERQVGFDHYRVDVIFRKVFALFRVALRGLQEFVDQVVAIDVRLSDNTGTFG